MTWVSLTEKELAELARWADENHGGAWYVAYGKAIERSLKRKQEQKPAQEETNLIECQRCGRFIK